MTTQHVTTKFSVQNAERLVANIQSSNNTHYLFFSNPQTSSNDAIAANLTLTTHYLDYGFYEEIVGGKKIAATNVTKMIERREWTSNTVYDYYDDTQTNLLDTDFYVTVDTGIAVEVFKCIWNGGANNASTVCPTAAVTDAVDPFFELADGYKWKWMYSVGSANLALFVPASGSYVPCEPNANVSGNAVSGEIVHYVVANGGLRYNSYCNGSFTNVSIGGNSQILELQANTSSANDNFYVGCAIKLTGEPGEGEQRKIIEYNGVSKRIVIDAAFVDTPNTSTTYKIAPNIVITGDGVAANAIANMYDANGVPSTTNSIMGVEVTGRGYNYTFATVSANGNTGVIGVSVNVANIVAILSPVGGHGSNAAYELGAKYVGIALPLANTESSTISTDNDFHTIGILANPLFANVQFGVSNVSGTVFAAGNVITQNTTYATAEVVSYASNVMIVTNCTGNWVANIASNTYCFTSSAGGRGNPANIINNTQSKQFATFDNRDRLEISVISGPGFSEDEYIVQSLAGLEVANAYVQSANSTLVGLTHVHGNFQDSDVSDSYHVTGTTSTTVANTTAVIPADLVQRSGDLIYIENVIPVSRGPTQTETIRFVFKL